MSANVPGELRYTKDHEWTAKDGASVKVGITAHAVEQLGDITLVQIDCKVGDTLTQGKAFGTIESVKTLSDLYAPLAGKVTAVNADLDKSPELVNQDCYGKAWMIAIEPASAGDVDKLLDAEAYKKLL